MAAIEKVPDYLSRTGILIDLGEVKPSDKALLFRDMGMGDPLKTGRTIEDRVDLSEEAKKALKDQEGNPDYDNTGKLYVPK